MDKFRAWILLALLSSFFLPFSITESYSQTFSEQTSSKEHTAAIPQIVISTGGKDGGYWGAGTRFKAVAAEMGLAVEVIPSEGSLDNLSRLFDEYSPVNLAFSQADALQYYLNKNPTERNKLELLENLGQECIFILSSTNGKIRSDEDLRESSGLRLGISSPTSGVAATFDYMRTQLPDLRNIEVVYGDTVAAMDELGSAGAEVDAVMVVSRPREHVAEVGKAVDNPHRFRFVTLDDDHLTRELPHGRKVYRKLRLALPGAETPVETLCVRGLLLVNKRKVSGDVRNALTDLVSYHWMRIYATP